ncbi:DUF6049 family protein [Streptomyces sp. JJ38]|uniref:DUF6049 family protein n=1 Tax=Streptomyces sp. JJ38 TaxID=2738128 RepID=UPI001C5A45A0|nr:DUF6049 family protein [Streptomyces sp. JJ38]
MAEAPKNQGSHTPAVPGRRLRRAAAALIMPLSLLLAGSPHAGATTVAPHTAAPGVGPVSGTSDVAALEPATSESATGSRTAEVAITGVTPVTPGEEDTLTIKGSVTNRSQETITGLEVNLRAGPRLTTRSSIDRAAGREGFSYAQDGREVTDEDSAFALDDVAPGGTRPFTLKVPVEELELDASGVYQLGVAVSGRGGGSGEQVLGMGRTFLTWQTEPASDRTDVTFLWPLVSTPHLTARTASDEQQTPVFRDDDLVNEISPGGRLYELVRHGADLPVTWVVDPDLLASVNAMTEPYQVQTPEGPVAGTGRDAANRWLNELQRAVEDEEVVALPFGDPDVASLAHRGRDVSGALGHLQSATEAAQVTVETILNTPPSTDFAWPVEGAIDPSVVSVATSAGARNVIARSDSLREDRSLPYTPNAARPIGGGITAVSADATLSTLFQGDMTRADNSTSAVQRFLSHTLAITEQNPTKQRSILVAPQRMPTASQAATMATAIEAVTDSGGWARFVDLGETAKAKPDPQAKRQVPGRSAYPKHLREQELPTAAFEAMRGTQSTLNDFTVILSQEDRVVTPFGNAIRREMSTSWRGRAEDAADYRDSVQDYLVGLTDQVRLVPKSPMTLSGRSATIPVTVQNNLVQEVDGLELRLTSGRRIGLTVDDDVKPVVVEGGHSQSITFDTTANANGRTFLTARLYTKDGDPYGEPMTFQVDVTEITSTVLLVIAGGVLLVVLAGVRMYTQRKRRGPQPDPDAPLASQRDEAEAEPEAAAEDGAENGARNNATADTETEASPRPAREAHDDTRPESGESSGPGEKVDC